MPALRVILLWHQHQPFYKDLVTGEYRLPWTRLHALKDYYGMVKLLDEFPNVHQNFNLVPSLMVQIQDYVEGTAQDPFLRVAAKPAKDLSVEERRFALQYLFQANPQNVIGRYPRYRELWERFREHGDHPERAERYFQAQDFTDLQVLSQIAWFDEFFLEEKDIAALVAKGHSYSLDDQKFVIARERELIGPSPAGACGGGEERIDRAFGDAVLSSDSAAGVRYERGGSVVAGIAAAAEPISASGGRARATHARIWICTRRFSGCVPRACGRRKAACRKRCWPSRTALACKWMATDEGVLGRSTGLFFARDGNGRLPATSGGETLQHPSL